MDNSLPASASIAMASAPQSSDQDGKPSNDDPSDIRPDCQFRTISFALATIGTWRHFHAMNNNQKTE